MVAGSFIIPPAASGLWTADSDPIANRGVGIGIVALGYILLGIMHHLVEMDDGDDELLFRKLERPVAVAAQS